MKRNFHEGHDELRRLRRRLEEIKERRAAVDAEYMAISNQVYSVAHDIHVGVKDEWRTLLGDDLYAPAHYPP